MKYPFFKPAAFVLAALAFGACHKTDDGTSTNSDTTIPETFNFKTTKNIDLTLSAIAGSEKLTSASVIISSKRPAEGTAPVDTIAQGAIDTDGKLLTSFQVDASVDSVYAFTQYPSLNTVTAIATGNGGTISGSLIPQSAASGRFASALRTIVWGSDVSDANGYKVMGSPAVGSTPSTHGWNDNGTPFYMELPGDVIPNSLLAKVASQLPEWQSVPADPARKYMIADDKATDLVLSQASDVWITFVSEGASYQNGLGFIRYNQDSTPTKAQVTSYTYPKTILYPNASLPGAGGDINPGERIKLGTFPAKSVLSWFLVGNGFKKTTSGKFKVVHNGTGHIDDSTIYTYYGHSDWNPESTPANRKHMVLLNDAASGKLVLGFEDQNRDKGTDNDFNDCLFYITISNKNAIDPGTIAVLNPIPDSDGDGIDDNHDEYPKDKDRAYNNYSPGINKFGTLAYEDLWPAKGDYDMNDLVIGYNYNTVTNASNKVVEVKSKFKVRAVGAGYNNGFGIQFDAAPSAIKGVTRTQGTDLMRAVSGANETSVANNGAEAGTTDGKASVIIFNQALKMVKNWGTGKYFNTETGTSGTSDTLGLTITFDGTLTLAQLGAQPYNPFIFVNHNRKVEVHLPDYKPTSLADLTKLGTSDDKSNTGAGRYYKSTANMPFALHTLTDFQYPSETSSITKAYLKFASWAQSSGTTNKDWYTNTGSGYRNSSLIYTK